MSYAKTTASAAKARIDKKKQFFFLHGDDEAAIEEQKRRIVETHLSPDAREENYREIIPTAQSSLRGILGDVLAELSTVSFLPTSKRIVTLYTVQDFFEARSGGRRASSKSKSAQPEKRTASENLADFIRSELPQLPAVLIIVAIEDYEKWKKVSTGNPVVDLARQHGTIFSFKESSPQFAFFDALFARRTSEAISLWREWLERAKGSPKPYYQLASQLRLLIQAKTASGGQLQARGVSREQFAKELLPSDPDKNFFSVRPEWRQDKLKRFSGNFSLMELLNAYEKLEPLQKFAIPVQSDPYVPDKGLLAEFWIVEFTARSGAG